MSEMDRASKLSSVRLALMLKQLRSSIEGVEWLGREPIAVIGLGCRFPGAADGAETFFELLASGTDAVAEIPQTRWDLQALYDPDPDAPGKMYGRHAALLADPYRFDAEFFGIAPREAAHMDPQQRLLLETGWAAIEDAAILPSSLAGSAAGVFVGVCANDHIVTAFRERESIEAYSSSGAAHSIIANRLSYWLDLRGPSLAVDTACSSSLVAVHLACQSLRAGETNLALAAGVNVVLEPEGNIALSKARMMAPDGRCKTFDARADGYVRGEGCGVVVLKRLADALRDRDIIRAVIRGSAVNQDGRSNGLTAPNQLAQQALLRQALDNAALDPGEVAYVEAHGTGTALGDPIEVDALREVYAAGTLPCAIGSVKTNFGHLEGAAGIAGLIKAVISLERARIFPQLHFQRVNPSLPLAGTRFFVPTATQEWPAAARRCAAVSSFGFGGTNAHLVLEAAPVVEATVAPAQVRPADLLLLSARTPSALAELARRYAEHLVAHPEQTLADVCFTANTTRAVFAERLAVVATSRSEAIQALERAATNGGHPGLASRYAGAQGRPRIAFLFSGQGSQYVGMGRELYEEEEVFRSGVDRCLGAIEDGGELRRVWERGEEAELERTEHTQPALFALEYGLSELWRSWGVEPVAVLGHSVGEYAAACVAGALEPEAGMRLVKERGRLMQGAESGGRMLAVFTTESEVAGLMRGEAEVSIAAVNGGGEWVLSGPAEAMQRVEARCAAEGVKWRGVKTSHAFHSGAMEPILEGLRAAASRARGEVPKIKLLSNLTGEVMSGAPDGEYWRRHAREAVRFDKGLSSLREQGCDVFIELGPQPVLLGLGQRALTDENLVWLPSLRRGQADRRQLLQSLGRLFVRGGSLAWDKVEGSRRRRRVSLPGYAFQGTSMRAPRRPAPAATAPSNEENPLGQRQRSAVGDVSFEVRLGADSDPSSEHVIRRQVIFPAAGFLALWLLAAREAELEGRALEDIVFREPLILAPAEECWLHTVQTRSGSGSFLVASRPTASGEKAPFRRHVDATIGAVSQMSEPRLALDHAAWSGLASSREMTAQAFYDGMEARGYELGPAFRWLTRLCHHESEAFGLLRAAGPPDHAERYVLHPGVIDACFQLFGLTWEHAARPGSIYVPFSVERFRVGSAASGALSVRVRRRASANEDGEAFTGDIELVDELGRLVAAIDGLCVRRATALAVSGVVSPARYVPSWRIEPEAQPRPLAGGGWLVFGSGRGLGPGLVQALAAQGKQALLVTRGTTFERRGALEWALDPRDPRALRELLSGAQPETQAVRGVVYLSEFEGTGGQDGAEASLASLLRVFQSAAEQSEGAKFWIVTRGGQALDSQDVLDGEALLAQAPLWGFGRVAALEHPEIWGGLLDLDPAVAAEPARVARLILASAPKSELAVRAGECRAAAWRREPVSAATTASFSADATYLITGGLGGLGLATAAWLVSGGARHLVLVQRGQPSSAASEAVEALRARGAEVRLERADVAERSEVARILRRLAGTSPPLRGIIHAAGALDDGVILQQTPERLVRALAAKARGALWLSLESQELSLDFFVLFSSIAAVLGSPGQANYAAANALLDALAWTRRARGLPALSVNFGPWADVGMAARTKPSVVAQLATEGLESMTPPAALAGLAAALHASTAQIAILAGEWPALRHATKEVSADAAAGVMARLERARGAERAGVMRRFVQEQAAAVLGYAAGTPLDPRIPLRDVGLDSLMALTLSKRLGRGLGRTLPPALLFNHPSVEEVSAHLLGELSSGVAVELAAEPSPPHEAVSVSVAALKSLSEQELGAAIDEEIERLARGA